MTYGAGHPKPWTHRTRNTDRSAWLSVLWNGSTYTDDSVPVARRGRPPCAWEAGKLQQMLRQHTMALDRVVADRRYE